jgi:hypothetical protein
MAPNMKNPVKPHFSKAAHKNSIKTMFVNYSKLNEEYLEKQSKAFLDRICLKMLKNFCAICSTDQKSFVTGAYCSGTFEEF